MSASQSLEDDQGRLSENGTVAATPRRSRGRSGDDEESQKERRDRELIELLNELRVVLTGVQVLFAFLLTLPFTERFSDLVPTQRSMYAVAFIATATASILLMAPTAYHRIRFRQEDKERMLRWANRFAIAGMCLLAFAIGVIVLLVIDVLYERRAAGVIAGALTLLLTWAWFALPLFRRMENVSADRP